MTNTDAYQALDSLEAQLTTMAVEAVRTIAEIRARLAMVQEIVEIDFDRWEEVSRERR